MIKQEPVDAPIDRALDALRAEWRAGFNSRLELGRANNAVRRLRDRAASAQAAQLVNDVEKRLMLYRSLSVDKRPDELKAIAETLEAIRPQLRYVDQPAPPVGTLPSAITPERTPRKNTPVERPLLSLSVNAPVTDLPKVGSSVAKRLFNLGVETVGDLLDLSPRFHIDYSRTVKIGSAIDLKENEQLTIKGEIIDLQEHRGPGATRVVIKLSDGTGWIRVTWFNPYLARQLHVGDVIAVSGQIEKGFGRPQLTSPEWERVGENTLSTGRMVPVYPLTKDLGQKTLRGLTSAALDAALPTLGDFLPGSVRQNVPAANIALADAYANLHYPQNEADLELAQRRLAFNDLLLLQIGLVRRKRARKAQGGIPLKIDRQVLNSFQAQLPFTMTSHQFRALEEILEDLTQPRPMTRLLQGDVGSGKTVVAASAALVACLNRLQTAVMAPTEILAEQHYYNFRGLYQHLEPPLHPRVALLTGSTRKSERRQILTELAEGSIDILIGTHALLQDDVQFHDLALMVVDEQHRFGVRQRAEIPNRTRLAMPHVLSMTATPIPRTLNMVVNGDLDVSIIEELPPGRIPIETRRYFGPERTLAYDLVRQEITSGRQCFVICPLVEESDLVEAKAAVAEAQRLQEEVFPDLRVSLLHGRMSGRDKDAILTAFRDGEADVLVSTSVIEVGIDIPNATVMMIEGADRFGLAQLHQFRGRVGRGGHRSYCLLLADESTPEGEQRLDAMVQTTNGFVLAEKDLELRGPGDFIGTRQSGLPEMAWIDGSFDTRLLDQARVCAESLLESDPDLTTEAHRLLRERVDLFWQKAAVDVPL